MPNRYADAVGPFVFLDHIGPTFQLLETNGSTGAHPHRGIATLTYVINGEAEHFDSAGNHERVRSGGVQWMKAGNGILHDETLNTDSQAKDNYVHALQFWINLPATNKAEAPEYLALQVEDVPWQELGNQVGTLRLIAGSYADLVSPIPSYSEQFLYHIQLQPGKRFMFPFAESIEVAAFLPSQNAVVNGNEFQSGEFVEFDRNAGEITVENKADKPIDMLLFGGEPYTEPIVAEGPFVMNARGEIADAYRDFYNGKYGKIAYPKRK